jgi:hypothetical protein
MSSFQLPPLGDFNCWGPPPVVSGESVLSIVSAPASETLQDLPYHPFNKADKLFRISDWTAPVRDDRFKRDNLALGEEDPEADEGGAFSLVDNRPKLKPRYGTKFTGNKKSAPSFNNNNRSIRGPRLGRGGAAGRNGQRRPMRRWAYAQADRERALREASVQISEEWKHIQDLDMIQLGNYVADVDDGEDLEFAGSLQSFNPVFNRVTPRQPSTLNKFENRRHFTASTSEDAVLLDMIQNKQGHVFATDSILVSSFTITSCESSCIIQVVFTCLVHSRLIFPLFSFYTLVLCFILSFFFSFPLFFLVLLNGCSSFRYSLGYHRTKAR